MELPILRQVTADSDPRDTFAGVGMVLSEWEGIEVSLCRIYSFFLGDPDGPSMQAYGKPTIFRNRWNGFKAAGEQFFVSHCNQDLEGFLEKLETELLEMADRRNEVAHGIVMPINGFSFAALISPPLRTRTNYWAVMPAYYNVRKHDNEGMPQFIYGASDLVEITTRMSKVQQRLSDYRETLRELIHRRNGE
jgi:hypothetical protein